MTTPSPDAGRTSQAIAANAMQMWLSGRQSEAQELLRPLANSGEVLAASLMAWFLYQTGEPNWRSAIPYVERAVRGGNPLTLNYVLPNMMNDASLRPQAAELIKTALDFGLQADPVGYAQQFLQHGDIALAEQVLQTPASPYPATPEGWQDLVAQAREYRNRLADDQRAGDEGRRHIDDLVAEVEREAADSTSRIKTQTGQLFTLIQAATNRQAEAIFEDEASSLRKEESWYWRAGIVIVSAAAVIAVLPLTLHYVGQGPQLTSAQLLAAHFTAAASFAAVSGVMLARARGRDRARQRARDLTLALSTMFAYAGQIQEEAERSRFTYEMGRVVIESFLRADASSGSDESAGLLTALLKRS